jgi:pimeloyl-ACP methyl ester carboxylesterase
MTPLHIARNALVAAILAVPALGAPVTSGNSTDGVSWGPCPTRLNETMQCANISVPLDWSKPDGEKITVGFAKLPARDPSRRIGYLLINPGGPGEQASGSVSRTARIPQRLDPELLNRFDLLGLDGRGIGLSTPLQCDKNIYNRRVQYFAKTQQEFDAMVAHTKALGASCEERSGRLIHFMDTVSTARDIEAVRLALGGDKFSFAGLSYGSQLYATYANLYPDGIRAMLLDAALQHSQGEVANVVIETEAYEATLKYFFDWCGNNTNCTLHGQDAAHTFLAAVARAEKDGSIPAPGCDDVKCAANVTLEEFHLVVQSGLHNQVDWPDLSEAIKEAAEGNATLLALPLLDGSSAYDDSTAYAERAVLCQDWTREFDTLAKLKEKQAVGAAFAPLTTGHTQSYRLQTYCLGWPAAVTNPPRPFEPFAGPAQLLVSNAFYDPSTSYAWAVGMTRELGDRATLLSRNGPGHTSFYLIGGDTAAAEAAYLLNLTVPAEGTVLSS